MLRTLWKPDAAESRMAQAARSPVVLRSVAWAATSAKNEIVPVPVCPRVHGKRMRCHRSRSSYSAIQLKHADRECDAGFGKHEIFWTTFHEGKLRWEEHLNGAAGVIRS